MTSPTPIDTTDHPASDAVHELDVLIKDGTKAAELAAEAGSPTLQVPLVKQLFEAVCNGLVNWLIQPLLNTFTGRIIVKIQEYEALKSAVSAQTALDLAAQSGDLNAQAEAQAVLDFAVAKAAQYIGAVKP